MNKLAILVSILLLSSSMLISCTSKPKLTATNWYLKSEFTWWEARPEYMLHLNEEAGVLEVQFTLRPDGQAYHLKLADKSWSVGKNCGSPQNNTSAIEIDTWYPVYCDPQSDPITPLNGSYRFHPKDNAVYKLKVRFYKGLPSEMLVSKQ
ncbi:hypothetical protein KO525_14585 [Psychrosphaera sp. B3R10]|nr:MULTISPECIES: hypothetical protein [unclassified Psychrosphaera]MBU2883293.1 hypothetical protein [Psychrosphaera sp. I2R16]MBU2990613.1 hypothetical protein [Psychrosphaera sp. B3R10]